jgi:hypothetical protein
MNTMAKIAFAILFGGFVAFLIVALSAHAREVGFATCVLLLGFYAGWRCRAERAAMENEALRKRLEGMLFFSRRSDGTTRLGRKP